MLKKDIYFYWGNTTMSYMRYMTLYSFCKFNPKWNVFIIINNKSHERNLVSTVVEKQDSTEFVGKDYSHLIKDLDINILYFNNKMLTLDDAIIDKMSNVHIKDMLNWKILAESGGIVADMDILFTSPIDEAIDSTADIGLICFENYPLKNYIPVSFMYSAGNSGFFNDVYKKSIADYNPKIYESCGTKCVKEKNLDEVRKNYATINVQRLTDDVVFPFVAYPWGPGVEMLYNIDNSSLMGASSKGIHWYGGAPQSQEANNLINDETVHKINNTITSNIRRII